MAICISINLGLGGDLNVEIMPYVFFVPEAKLRDTKHTVGIISI